MVNTTNEKEEAQAVAVPIGAPLVPPHVEDAFEKLKTKELQKHRQLLKDQVTPFPKNVKSVNQISLVNSDVRYEMFANGPIYQDLADAVNEDLESFFQTSFHKQQKPKILSLYTRIVWLKLPEPCHYYRDYGVGAGKLAIAWVLAASSSSAVDAVYVGRKFVEVEPMPPPCGCLCANEEKAIRTMGLNIAKRILKDIQDELK